MARHRLAIALLLLTCLPATGLRTSFAAEGQPKKKKAKQGVTPVFGSALGRFLGNRKCQALKPAQCMVNDMINSNAWCPSLNAAYIKVPKANSKGIRRVMKKVCGAELTPKQEFRDHSFSVQAHCPPYAYTFVREPMDRAIAAYGEIDTKTELKEECAVEIKRSGATFWKIKRKSEPKRFEAFLQDLSKGLIPKPCEPRHGSRQVESVCSVPEGSLRAIGKMETFEKDMRGILKALNQHREDGCPHSTKPDLLKGLNSTHFADHVHRQSQAYNKIYDASVNAVRKNLRAKTKKFICSLYAADYECFGYPKPQECSNGQA